MSGWWFSASASSATRFTKAIACGKPSKRTPLERAVDLAPSSGHHVSMPSRSDARARRAALAPHAQGAAVVRALPPSSSSVRWPTWSSSCWLPLRVPPPAVVVAGTAVGFWAAGELWAGNLVLAAVLLQVKTRARRGRRSARACARAGDRARALPRLRVGPARQRGAVRALGHGDREVVARGDRVRRRDARPQRRLRPRAALPARARRAARGAARGDRGGAAVLGRIYDVVYAPQDRLVEWFVERRLRGAAPRASGSPTTTARR